MTTLIGSLDELAHRYDAVLCDLWGCYHDGIQPYPAAEAALRRFRAGGGIVILLTNAPRPAASVRVFLDRIGADPECHDAIMSSGEACQRALASGRHGRAFHYVGPGRDLHMLEDIGLAPVDAEAADAILCTGLFDDRTETPADYDARIAEWREAGLALLCANPDIVVDRGTERLWCAGAIAERYAEAGGEVVWFGKPHAPTYRETLALLSETAGREVPAARILGAGDGLRTDVAGAVAQGIDALFVSGGLAAAEVGDDPEHPDPARLAAHLDAAGATPRWTIGRLR